MKVIYSLFIMLMTFSLAQGQLIISEIMYNPPESGQDSLEYIEIYNPSPSDLDISSYSFTEGVMHEFPDGTTIKGESYMVIAKSASAMQNVFGLNVMEWNSGALSNGGEPITIVDPFSDVVASVEYSDGGDWPGEADGEGFSLEICDLSGSQSDPSNWDLSNTATGIILNGNEIYASPMAQNSSTCLSSADQIVEVSDFQFDPADITIAVGETVLWNNVQGNHNVNGTQGTFPSNPESFASGMPADAPWTYSYTFTEVGTYRYQCDPHQAQMQGNITVVSNLYPNYSIEEVTTTDSEGVADSIDVQCTLTGIVETPNFRPGGLTFTMQENEQDGINVFSDSDNYGYDPKVGDEVTVKGTIDQFNGLTQIIVDSIELNSQGNDIYGPVTTTEMNEGNENTLVSVEDVSLIDPSNWESAGSFNIDVSNGTDTLTLRIDESNGFDGMAPPEETFNVTGVVGQFDPTSPFLHGYQLFPRSPDDIDPYIVSGPDYPEYNIEDVTGTDSQGLPDSLGVNCTLQGVVVNGNYDTDGYLFSIINSDNTAGITVYRFNKIGGYEPENGDRVEVKGEISQFNGLTQIEIDSVELVNTGNDVGSKVEYELNESMESRNIFLKDAKLVNVEPFSGDGSTINVDIESSSGNEYVMRITDAVPLADVEIDPTNETNNLNIEGVVGQYDTSEPYDEGYQIFPYSEIDLLFGFVSVDFVSDDVRINVFPNPAINVIHLESEVLVKEVRIYDSEGKQIQTVDINARKDEINISQLHTGSYNLLIKTDKGYAVRKILKQE